jgi:hypothetical protein
MLPLQILNRLRLGRDVAAQVEPRHAECLAWVLIDPIVDQDKAKMITRSGWSEPMIGYRVVGENPILGFRLRFVEMPVLSVQKTREYSDDWDYFIVLASHEVLTVPNEDSLNEEIANRGITTNFGIPVNVDFPEFLHHQKVIDRHRLTRQVATTLRRIDQNSLLLLRFTEDISLWQSHDEDNPDDSESPEITELSGLLSDLTPASVIFSSDEASFRMPLTFLAEHLLQQTINVKTELDWMPVHLELDHELADFTELDCWHPTQQRWTRYSDLFAASSQL